MTHPEDLLADYVDGTLSSQDRAVVEAHLSSCSRCRDEATLARGAVRAIRSLPEVPAPTGLGRAAIEDAGALTPIGVASGSYASRRYRFLAVAAAAAVVAVIAIALPRLGGTNQVAATADTGATSQANKGGELGGQGSTARSPSLEIQQTDYNPTSAGKLATSAAAQGGSVSPAMGPIAEPRAADSADTQTALSCLRTAFAGFPGDPIRLIQASFQGKAAYIGVYAERAGAGLPPNTVSVRVAALDGCSLLNYASAKI